MDDSKKSPSAVYWMTRDSESGGRLSDKVDVWLSRPERHRLDDGSACWLGQGELGLDDRYAEWTIEDARRNAYVYPETDRECIQVGTNES